MNLKLVGSPSSRWRRGGLLVGLTLLLLTSGSINIHPTTTEGRTILPDPPASLGAEWTAAKDRTAGGPILLEVPHREELRLHPAWSLLDHQGQNTAVHGELRGEEEPQVAAQGDGGRSRAGLRGKEQGFCFIVHGCWGGFNLKLQGQVSKLMTYLQTHHHNPLLLAPSDEGRRKHKKIAFVVAAGDNFYKKGVNNEHDLRFATTFENMYPVKPKSCSTITGKQEGNHKPSSSSFSSASPSCPTNVPWFVNLGNHDYRGNFTAQVHYTTLMQRYAHQQHHQEQQGRGDPQQLPLSVSHHTNRWFMPYYYYAQSFGGPPRKGQSTNQEQQDVEMEEKKSLLLMLVLDCPLLERCAVNPKGSPRCFDNHYQLEWVKEVLEAEAKQHLFTVAICHYPMYANGPHINYAWLHSGLQPLLEQYGVSIYYNADNHYLQIAKVPHGSSDIRKAGGDNHQNANKQVGKKRGDVVGSMNIHPNNNNNQKEHEGLGASILYVNSGGGGGYMPHTRKDKGYKKNPFTVFEEMAMGVTVQCVDGRSKQTSLEVFDVSTFQSFLADNHGGEEGELLSKESPPLKPRYLVKLYADRSETAGDDVDGEPEQVAITQQKTANKKESTTNSPREEVEKSKGGLLSLRPSHELSPKQQAAAGDVVVVTNTLAVSGVEDSGSSVSFSGSSAILLGLTVLIAAAVFVTGNTKHRGRGLVRLRRSLV